MNIHDIFPSRYLKAHDLGGKSFTLTIRQAQIEELGQLAEKEQCLVLYFIGAKKGFVCNRTNAMIIADLYSPETDNWVGKAIILYPTQVRAFGKINDAIRVKPQLPPPPKAKQDVPQGANEEVEEDEEEVAQRQIDQDTGEIMDGDALFGREDAPAPAAQKDKVLSQAQLTRLNILGADLHGKQWDSVRAKLVTDVSKGAVSSSKALAPDEASILIQQLERELRAAQQQQSNGKVAA
jgi:hypothetical protein